ncbi:hypothetical protein ACHAO1_009028 [Botrytis cinerea]
MSYQKVFRLASQGSHHNIQSHSEPIPTIDAHEILVKIRGLALNYRGLAITNGTYPFPVKDNVIPCSDAAGKVVKVGSRVDNLKIGDRVIAEYAVLPAYSVIKVPDGARLSFTQIAALVCTGVTAWNALYGNAPLKPGQTVLFQAKAAGAQTIITSSSDDKLTFVKRQYHPDHVINYKTTPNWADEAKRLNGGEGVDYIFENGGSGTIGQSIECTKMEGIIAVIGFLSAAKQEDMPDVAGLALSKGCFVIGITVGSKQLLKESINFIVSKGLQPPVEKSFKFSAEGVTAAYDYIQGGIHIGKICIDVD